MYTTCDVLALFAASGYPYIKKRKKEKVYSCIMSIITGCSVRYYFCGLNGNIFDFPSGPLDSDCWRVIFRKSGLPGQEW